jgi:DNA-binding SARP family transcriptional activator/DNA-binding XRE family transcriptional regulator
MHGMGALIKGYREGRQATQRELAAAAGISLGALRDLEQGRSRSPRWGTVEQLAAVLGLDLAQRAELAAALRTGAPRDDPARQSPGGGVRVSVLGPLTAWRDGVPLTLGSARQRAVLGLLALQPSVHRDAIIDLLWGERPPASAVAEVQRYVSRLRKLLGDDPARAGGARRLTTTGGCCYQLNVGPGGLDLAVFEQLTRQAREAADPARACERCAEALGLWRGDVLVNVDLLRGHPAVVEVRNRRADAVLRYARAATRVGASAEALPHLRELCAEEPLNEQAHAWLMTVLAATGQQAAALQVFADVRRRLEVELGIGPSLVLAQARTTVLSGTSGAGDAGRRAVVARVRAVEADFDRSPGGDRSVVGSVSHGDRGA